MKLTTSKKEIIDLLKAWAAITIAFGIVLFDREGSNAFLIAAFSVGLGFLLHELAHKIVAQYYHLLAEFRSFDGMLVLAIAMSFFGFVFAAPGAVMIRGLSISNEKNGRISLAGPLTNLVLALVFLGLMPFLGVIAKYGLFINALIALFNMLPFWNFDGAKILRWNKLVYFGVVFVAFVLFSFSNL
tara:strand:+ start:80 stop:637 length:558 start_codon:yes stop_codon:yes gene_type:complete